MQIVFHKSVKTLLFAAIFAGLALLGGAPKAADKEDIAFARSFVKVKLESAKTGSSFDWTNPDNGHKGSMRIVETQIFDRGRPCRWYQWSIDAGPKSKIETEGKGCRLSNGEWLLEETAVIRETVEVEVRVEVPVEVERPAPEPKDPMDDVTYSRPDSSNSQTVPDSGVQQD